MTKTCPHCRQEFGPGKWTQNFKTKRFCSRRCFYGWRRSIPAMLERFWANVVKTEGCWEYQTLNVEGYGIIANGYSKDRKQYLAHRFAWFVYNGEHPPADKAVCHHCDNPRCVRPDHLFVGTWKDNAQDKMRKGRQTRGETTRKNKLTAQAVLEIRRDFRKLGKGKRAPTNGAELAARYGVAVGAIQNVIYGRTWMHVTGIDAAGDRS